MLHRKLPGSMSHACLELREGCRLPGDLQPAQPGAKLLKVQTSGLKHVQVPEPTFQG